jgi:hypothetical protein
MVSTLPTTYAERLWMRQVNTAISRGGGELWRRLGEYGGAVIQPDWWAQMIVDAASQKGVRSAVREHMVRTILDHPRFEPLPDSIQSDVVRTLLRKHQFACFRLLTERGFTLKRDEWGCTAVLSHINEGKWPMLELLWPDICQDQRLGGRVLRVVTSASFLCNPSGAQGMVKLVRTPEAAEIINQAVGRCLSSALAKLDGGKPHALAKRTLAILAQHDWMQIERVREHARDYHRQPTTPIDGFLSDIETMTIAQHTPMASHRKSARRI